jgi:hypothetical protein
MGWNWLMGNSHFSQHLRNPFVHLHDWEDDDRFWRNLPRHLLIAYAAGCDVAIVVVDDCFERDWQSYWCCWKEEGRCCDC